MLTIRHDALSSDDRAPQGAVPAGAHVNLRVRVESDDAHVDAVRCFYLYGLNDFNEGHVLMTREAAGYTATLTMPEAGLFYYWFEVRLADGRYRWGFPDDRDFAETLPTSRTFAIDGRAPIPAFQITVTTSDFTTPDWMKGAVLYQIFPDRFARGSAFDEARALRWIEARPERIWHHRWEDEVDRRGKPPKGYEACDFFGGTLSGIREHLDRLRSFGVSVLYLNPIFEARSNHRYDAGDYLRVDPLLGTNDDLRALCDAAHARGMKVILDIALSHTGADSRYFNRYGRYDTVGAWQAYTDGVLSPFAAWYTFDEDPERQHGTPYRCWWGFPELPNVNELDASYQAFIFGDDGVLAHWLRLGCDGFRLDVSDELPDPFLRRLRACVKRHKPDAFILGEVWEEPTSKISYGAHRDFLFGRTHDAVMGYTFREAVIDFLNDDISGTALARRFRKMVSVTPAEALYTQMNLLGSHDTVRIATALRDPRRIVAAARLQLAFPGATALYYGDELGMEGGDDPYNRRTYRWDAEPNARVLDCLRLKCAHPVLQTGYFDILDASDATITMRRFAVDGRDAFGRPIDDRPSVTLHIDRAGDGEITWDDA